MVVLFDSHNFVVTINLSRMKVQKISTSFSSYSDPTLEQKADYILKQMTGNDLFPAPSPSLLELETNITSYGLALTAAAGLDRTKVAFKNEIRQQLELLMGKLGMHVMNVALGNIAMLTSSGYSLMKAGSSVYIDNPGSVSIANGNTSGELVASVPTVKGAVSYLHQSTTQLPTEATQWESNISSRSKFTYSNLQPGKQYWVRVAAIGSRDQIAYSPVATQFAQ